MSIDFPEISDSVVDDSVSSIVESGGRRIVGEGRGVRYLVRLIAGNVLGSSGYYSAEVLRRDGPKVFVAGTKMFLNHQRSSLDDITKLAGVLESDSFYDGDGLYARVKIYDNHVDTIRALCEDIGVSIHAAGLMVPGVVGGKAVRMVKSLVKPDGRAATVDFVVNAGAEGAITAVLESGDKVSEIVSDLKEGLVMDEDVKKSFEAMNAQIGSLVESVNALLPKVESQVVESADPYVIADALAVSGLTKESYKHVINDVKGGVSLTDAISSQKAFVAAIREGFVPKDTVTESLGRTVQLAENSATEGNKYAIPTGWSNS